jgi:hypothetical protein
MFVTTQPALARYDIEGPPIICGKALPDNFLKFKPLRADFFRTKIANFERWKSQTNFQNEEEASFESGQFVTEEKVKYY